MVRLCGSGGRKAVEYRAVLFLALCWCAAPTASAEVLVRWDQDRIPSAEALGIRTVVVPADNARLVREALAQGYRVLLEIDPAALPKFKPPTRQLAGLLVAGTAPASHLAALETIVAAGGGRVFTADQRGKWPHIRTNWVTQSGEVLHVTSRSAQPWIETNAAAICVGRSVDSGHGRLLTYAWQPITPADTSEGPSLENYLVAIAEAGTFGADLLLPLHPRFQQNLLLGLPHTRAEWNEIRRYLDFYSWNLPTRYRPTANVAVVSSDPAAWYEVMNLLLRHNVPFEALRSTRLVDSNLSAFDLLLVLDEPDPAQRETLAQFARQGGTVLLDRRSGSSSTAQVFRGDEPAVTTPDRIRYRLGSGRVIELLKGIPDPNAFALEVRQLLGRQGRVIDIWNGITVLSAPYHQPDGASAMIAAVNYAHQPLPVQLRIRGTYSMVQYESPEEPAILLPFQHRDGATEFVVPSLRVGGRIFLGEKR
jgi:hypothetical protein